MENKRKPYKIMPSSLSTYVKYIHQESGIGIAEMKRRYPAYSKTTLFRHMKGNVAVEFEDRRHGNRGRPREICDRDERLTLRNLTQLRETVGTFSSQDIQTASCSTHLSNRTVRRVLKKHKYGFYQCRKKGILTKEDLTKRLKFAKKCKKLAPYFWTDSKLLRLIILCCFVLYMPC